MTVKESNKLDRLQDIVAERLLYNFTWNNVEIVTKKNHLEIKWFDPKKPDPPGKKSFCSRIVAPFNKDTIKEEIKRHKILLGTDKRRYKTRKKRR